MTSMSLIESLKVWTLLPYMAQYKDDKLLGMIAERLKALREERGLTQEAVYNELDIHIARIETAKLNVTVSTISKLCNYFGITLSDFFSEMEKA